MMFGVGEVRLPRHDEIMSTFLKGLKMFERLRENIKFSCFCDDAMRKPKDAEL